MIRETKECTIPVDRDERWDKFFLSLARHTASMSKDPSTQVGSVITKGKFVVSLGFNGFAQGMADLSKRYENKAYKHDFVLHAEENAILTAKQDLKGCSVYVWPFMPCPHCCSIILQTGIKEVISLVNQRDYPATYPIYQEANVGLYLYPEDYLK